MSLLIILCLSAVILAAVGALIVVIRDRTEDTRCRERSRPDFNPYAAESLAYLTERRAA